MEVEESPRTRPIYDWLAQNGFQLVSSLLPSIQRGCRAKRYQKGEKDIVVWIWPNGDWETFTATNPGVKVEDELASLDAYLSA